MIDAARASRPPRDESVTRGIATRRSDTRTGGSKEYGSANVPSVFSMNESADARSSTELSSARSRSWSAIALASTARRWRSAIDT